MGLKIQDISAVLLKCGTGIDVANRVHDIFDGLVQNDRCCSMAENNVHPNLWECRWINEPSNKSMYYGLGDSVWINTDTDDQILESRFDEISVYVMQNPSLWRIYNDIDKNDNQKVNTFFKQVINGTASPGVSALYFLGDITQPVQIKISKKAQNNDYPSVSSSWYDFYVSNTSADNARIVNEVLNDCLSCQLSSHMDAYHGNDIDLNLLSKTYLKNNSATFFDNVTKQLFYNHSYIDDMTGFDYILKTKYDAENNRWYRLWNSGYLEQGGLVYNSGVNLIEVNFLMEYNYPSSKNFYQYGYDEYENQIVEGNIRSDKRYQVMVTPVAVKGSCPYQIGPFKSNDEANVTYTCVDVMKMDNDGFSFINTDINCESYTMYNYYVAGFRVVTDSTDEADIGTSSQSSSKFHKVRFFYKHPSE